VSCLFNVFKKSVEKMKSEKAVDNTRILASHLIYILLAVKCVVVHLGGTDIKCTYSSHTAWVSCVAWSPTHAYHFISGSYDQLVKLWDTRWYGFDYFLRLQFCIQLYQCI